MASCSEICGSGHAEQSQGVVRCGHPQYGVRSYLHQFYEECTASIWERDEDFQITRSPSRWSSVFWKVSLAFGTLILTTGLILLTAGYTIPSKMEAFGDGELFFVDSSAARFNHGLRVSQLAGVALFCAGGALLSGGLVLFTFTRSYSQEEKYLQSKFKMRIAETQPTAQPITRAPPPGEGRIPVTLSKVQNVQPPS
ncbi:neurensin 1-like [Brienomyrus brachyistius]|uniref:neurensin 1-like n=1 Tax=Brienomyrus brachyistius TaxID=42636 RepID=UPI0020B45934|nr:neurensin 1-like [Brienomyrus brachyistius]XP_048850443.1 neurensin 1-like [Brienomyrus brachyistius]